MLIDDLRDNAETLQIDKNRLCILAFSAQPAESATAHSISAPTIFGIFSG
jgi:hypothetical protein